jgi:hypothetical protein
MKVIKNIFFAALLFPLLFGCDEVDELLNEDFEITTSFTSSININIFEEEDPNMPQSFQESDGINLRTNAEIAEALDNSGVIQNVEILNIQYEYKNFNGNVDAVINSRFSLGTAFMDTQTFPIPDHNIAESDLFGTLYTLSGDFSTVNNFIAESNIFTYIYSGTVSHNPAFFIVEVTVTLKITIEVGL